jgi:hypothetical protein
VSKKISRTLLLGIERADFTEVEAPAARVVAGQEVEEAAHSSNLRPSQPFWESSGMDTTCGA